MKYKLIINCKNYEESTGSNFLKLVHACRDLEERAKQLNVDLILSPSTIDLRESISNKIQTYAQHIDAKNPGSQTGYTIPKILKNIGIQGTIISHSEHFLDNEEIKKTISYAKELGITTCVCARDATAAEEIALFEPDMIAVEPKELIGGDISISTARPQLISESLDAIERGSLNLSNQPQLLVGAGVKNDIDVRKAVELGARGILVASGVVKAQDPKAAIENLLEGFRE